MLNIKALKQSWSMICVVVLFPLYCVLISSHSLVLLFLRFLVFNLLLFPLCYQLISSKFFPPSVNHSHLLSMSISLSCLHLSSLLLTPPGLLSAYSLCAPHEQLTALGPFVLLCFSPSLGPNLTLTKTKRFLCRNWYTILIKRNVR